MSQEEHLDLSLSKKAKRNHLRSGGDSNCPLCGAEMEYMDYEAPEPLCGGILEQKAKCTKCNGQWVDTYKLVDVEIVDPRTGARW